MNLRPSLQLICHHHYQHRHNQIASITRCSSTRSAGTSCTTLFRFKGNNRFGNTAYLSGLSHSTQHSHHQQQQRQQHDRLAFNVKTRPLTTTASKSSSSNSKVIPNNYVQELLTKHLFHGASINIGGFGLGGIPETLIDVMAKHDKAQNLTIASLTAGVDGFGLGKLFEVDGKVKRILASYVGENKVSEFFSYGKINNSHMESVR